MKEEILSIKNQALGRILDTDNKNDLENLKIEYLGRNGIINDLLQRLKALQKEEKKEVGRVINETKKEIESAIARELKIAINKNIHFDPTVPGEKEKIGSLHIVTQAIEEITRVFERIGFVRARYPEVEWDWYAFESLNFDPLHPARDEWETFLMDTKPHKKYGPMLLTPHTSSGQVREMQRVGEPPIRMINIAKCYRRQSDVSHVPMFHQFEGLVVDKGISIAHLRGTLDYFAREFFGKGRKTRIRPYNFPFTEPSFEVDINCDVCKGKGKTKKGKCRLCKEGWLEIGGSGMVHPEVLKAGGIDSKKYTGFAFGWGVERVFMMKSGINIADIRTIYSSDLRYLTQF